MSTSLPITTPLTIYSPLRVFYITLTFPLILNTIKYFISIVFSTDT